LVGVIAELNRQIAARASCDTRRAAGDTRRALLDLANRLVGILHGCLRHHTPCDEHLAWHHHTQLATT
jgi:hypothetical protein